MPKIMFIISRSELLAPCYFCARHLGVDTYLCLAQDKKENHYLFCRHCGFTISLGDMLHKIEDISAQIDEAKNYFWQLYNMDQVDEMIGERMKNIVMEYLSGKDFPEHITKLIEDSLSRIVVSCIIPLPSISFLLYLN